MSYGLSIFIFRRELRLDDNTGLIAALSQSKEVLPCFIFDPRQVLGHEYFSHNAQQFLLDSISDLDSQLEAKGSRLHLLYGKQEEAVRRLHESEKFDAVFTNRDYTPFSRNRDRAIAQSCSEIKAKFHSYADSLLCEPEQALKPDGAPYAIFTHFFSRAMAIAVPKPEKNERRNYRKVKMKFENPRNMIDFKYHNPDLFAQGGRKNGLRILRNIDKYRDYSGQRNLPAREATTGLSPHLKFGTVSMREAYHAIRETLGHGHPLINELYWRVFFTHIAFNFPHVFGHPFKRRYGNLRWSSDKGKFAAWCEGRTGFPIVDAGMRQLNQTGFMHNRVRMIVASFLTKDLHIDWRWGERYFATKLADYDPSVNNGNWQWAASTGCDAQPYFRIFNPWLQQKRFDPECEYVRRWVPELRSLSPKEIHSLEKSPANKPRQYPEQIVEHSVESKIAKAMFSNLKGK